MTDETNEELPLTREALYELAWSKPMTSIGKQYGVSSSYLARVYTRMNVPRPAPGYWAKVEAGKKVRKPPLPEARPEDEIEWDRHHAGRIRSRPKPQAPSSKPRLSNTSKKKPGTHRLINGARAHFEKSRKTFNGYLRPYKRLLVDIIVSEKALASGLKIANELFLSIEDCGYRVTLETPDAYFTRPKIDEREQSKDDNRYENHWCPQRNTLVHVGTVAFGLTLIEVSNNVKTQYIDGEYIPINELTAAQKRYQRHTWTSDRDVPTGSFYLQVYSPYQGTEWVQRFQIDPEKSTTKIGQQIAKALHRACPEVLDQIDAAEQERQRQQKEWEEMKARWERERVEELHAKANSESMSMLHKLISDWAEAERIYAFFADLRSAVSSLPESERPSLTARIEEAEKFIAKESPLESLRQWKSPAEIIQEKESERDGIILP
jgi:hypothetical protein